MNVLVVSGKHHFLKKRFLDGFIQSKSNWDVLESDGQNLSNHLSGLVIGNSGKNLILVREPESLDVEFIKTLVDPNTLVLLILDGEPKGNTKFGKFVNALPKDRHKNFPLSDKDWELQKQAVEFLNKEVTKYKLVWGNPDLAEAIVRKCGPDLGFLSYEVLKVASLVMENGLGAITANDLNQTLADISDTGLEPLNDALMAKNGPLLAKALTKISKSSKSDQTMRITRTLAPRVYKWLEVCGSVGSTNQDAAAQALGINPWVYKNKILPPVLKWGQKGVIEIIRILAEAERNLKSGQLDPYNGMVARLVLACAIDFQK